MRFQTKLFALSGPGGPGTTADIARVGQEACLLLLVTCSWACRDSSDTAYRRARNSVGLICRYVSVSAVHRDRSVQLLKLKQTQPYNIHIILRDKHFKLVLFHIPYSLIPN